MGTAPRNHCSLSRLWHRKPTRGVPTGFVETAGPCLGLPPPPSMASPTLGRAPGQRPPDAQSWSLGGPLCSSRCSDSCVLGAGQATVLTDALSRLGCLSDASLGAGGAQVVSQLPGPNPGCSPQWGGHPRAAAGLSLLFLPPQATPFPGPCFLHRPGTFVPVRSSSALRDCLPGRPSPAVRRTTMA